MGQDEARLALSNKPLDKITRNYFDFQYVIGKGGFGKVWKVTFKKTGKVYAIKEMSKAKIIDKNSVDSIQGEREILSYLHHPFIVNMVYAFQDRDFLYLVMDLLPGGNLRYHLGTKKKFSEEQTSLEYIHKSNILHRDIKPENLVFDSKGYVRITDFGIAKKYIINNKKDTSGTVGYLAPEVLLNENHTFSIDYYSVGIITFEFIFGHRPYIGKSKREVKQLVLTKQAHIDYDDLPDNFTIESADFVNGLIQRKPKKRLGKNSINELFNHPWLCDFDWENLKKKKLKSPYIPKNGDNFDKKYCLCIDKEGNDTIERYIQIKNDTNYDNQFKFYSSEKIPDELKINFNNTPESIHNSSSTNISRNKNDTKNEIKTHNMKNTFQSIFESQNHKTNLKNRNNSDFLEKYCKSKLTSTIYNKNKLLYNNNKSINKIINMNGTFYLNKDSQSSFIGISNIKKRKISPDKKIGTSKSMESLKYFINSNNSFLNNSNDYSIISGKNNLNNSIGKRNQDKVKIILEKKLPSINISLMKKKSVFGKNIFNHHDIQYDLFSKLSERSLKNTNLKVNLDIITFNDKTNINKSLSLSKRESRKKLSPFNNYKHFK